MLINNSQVLVKILSTYNIPKKYIATNVSQFTKSKSFVEVILDKLRGKPDNLKGPDLDTYTVIGGKPPVDLYEAMQQVEPTFSEILLAYIDRSHYAKDSDVYKKAGLSKAAFSKIRSGHLPKRENVLRLALVLLLSLADTEKLLHAAGYAFQPNNKFDRFICFFLEEHEKGKDYDYDLLNLWCYEITGIALVGEK